MFDLNEFIFWQGKDLSEFDNSLALLLLFQEFNLDSLGKAGLLLEHFGNGKKLYPFYSIVQGYKYCYPFEIEHMRLAFEFFHDEMDTFKAVLSNADLTKETDSNEEKILEIINTKKQFEEKFESEYTTKMFGSEILDKLDKISLDNIKFDENYTVNGSLGKVKIGVNKDQYPIAVKINPIWRKSDVDVLKSFLENQKTVPQHNNLIQVYEIGLDVKQREGRRYEYAYFYSMEKADNLCNDTYCPKTLANILAGGNTLSPFEVIYLLKELAKGLKALHDSGKVQGKIRPENILWVDNVPKLSELTCVDNLPNPFSFKDTILPSEQKSSLFIKSSFDDDIYALTICAYCALTGNSERMFPEMLFEILKTNEGKILNKIFLKACSKSKKNRYLSVDKFLEDLEQIDIPETSILFNGEYTPPKNEKVDIFTRVLGEDIMSKIDDIKLKDYKVVKNFRGAGGFGDVRIYEHSFCIFRAIKRVNLNNPRARQEAESVMLYKEKAPEHPNLIKIFEVGCDTEIIDGVEENFFFYTMEAGDNLFELCYPEYRYYHPVSLQALKYKEKQYDINAMPEDNFTFSGHVLLKHVIEGLAALHNSGLVHRDIKPDNLVFYRGVLKISDIGLVTTIDSIDSLAGTEGYFPPEYLEESYINIQRLQEDAIKNDLFAAGISTLNAFQPSAASAVDIMVTGIISAINCERIIDVYKGSFDRLRSQEDYEDCQFDRDIELYLRLVKKICALDPGKRFNSASEILSEFPEDFVDSFRAPDEFDEMYRYEQDAYYLDYEDYVRSLGGTP